MPTSTHAIVPGLSWHWNFDPSRIMRWERRQELELFMRSAHRRPAWREIKRVTRKPVWVVYFLYTPDGTLSATHRFTLARLRELGLPLLVVCASPKAARPPRELERYCDALLWKDLPGYDFSAYTLALGEIARRSPGADVLVMNDSNFGPFTDLRPVIDKAPWDLTGFTASSQITNHIQSYAFVLRDVTRVRMATLAPVFFPLVSLSDPDAVIRLQEIRMARVASRVMKVGALWFGDVKDVKDPTLVRPLELLDAGHPFLKRSLLGKHKSFIDRERVLTRLEALGHPVEPGLQA